AAEVCAAAATVQIQKQQTRRTRIDTPGLVRVFTHRTSIGNFWSSVFGRWYRSAIPIDYHAKYGRSGCRTSERQAHSELEPPRRARAGYPSERRAVHAAAADASQVHAVERVGCSG
ncbi:MAG: hypothetical protein NTW28_27920, partial [Candidatus Solibacter sp.]|nr:hypothetical protein [Candidatus Solibacter sp.]